MKMMFQKSNIVNERETEKSLQTGVEGFEYALEKKKEKDEKEYMKQFYKSQPKKIIKNALTESRLETMQSMVEAAQNYRDRYQRGKSNKERTNAI